MPPPWVISLAIAALERLGAFSWAEGVAAKAGVAVVKGLDGAKVEYSYPTGKNNERMVKTYARSNIG